MAKRNKQSPVTQVAPTSEPMTAPGALENQSSNASDKRIRTSLNPRLIGERSLHLTQTILIKLQGWITGSLRVKTILLMAAVVIPLLAIYVWYDVQERGRILEEAQLKKAESMALSGAEAVAHVLEDAMASGRLTRDQVFDTNYQPIPDTNPQKYHTAYDRYTDANFLGISDAYLKDPDVVFAVAVDINGYLPTHNARYTQQLTGDYQTDLVGNRTKRIFDDTVGLAAARNTEPLLKTTYYRDTGEVTWDVSAPIDVNGEHWGAFRVAFSLDRLTQQKNAITQTTLLAALIFSSFIFGMLFLVIRAVTRPVGALSRATVRVAEGDLDQIVPVRSSDEIGSLANAFNNMTARLRQTLGNLEHRTRDLTLAAEVSRGVAQVRNLDALLADAVELIRARFDLYHTQVYLVDSAGRSLTLRAGTGSIGLELLKRGHRLPINSASLNGRAAAEKRALIVADTEYSNTFKPNPLLPETRSEIAMPLIVGDRVVGVLDLQSSRPGALSEDSMPAFEALAGQLAIAVENAALFTEAEQARREVEAHARRLAHGGWSEFLDAIERSERLGYTFDQQTLTPLAEPLLATSNPTTLDTPILVMGEPIGRIQLEQDANVDRPWNSADLELVSSIASRVATQLENLRLLAQAEQYRIEADAVMRHLTRESWESYRESQITVHAGYVYDLNQVAPLTDAPQGNGSAPLAQPLKVRNETIGELRIDEVDKLDEEATELVTTIADQLSAHIENLRLFEETERGRRQLDKRAAELETVGRVSAATSEILDAGQLLKEVVNLTKTSFGLYHTHIYLLDETGTTLILAAGAGEVGEQMVAQGWSIPLDREQSLVAQAASLRQGVISNDVRWEPGWMPNPLLPDTRAELAVPLIVHDKLLGVLDVQSDTINRFTDEDVNIQTALAAQVAIALHNANLYAEQIATVDRLRELDHLKSSFLANMSHELRTPLNSILGFSDVMLEGMDGPLTELMENDLRLINRNGQHLLSLINDVLDMAKIAAGKMNLNIERFNLHTVLMDVVNITMPLARDKALALQLETDTSPDLEIEADHTRLRQVMLNLVANAIKFTETGSVTIFTTRLDGRLRIHVRDTGISVPPEQAQMIFEEFGQLDTSTTRKAGGTGLGLPISRKLIELHGGQLWVESTGMRGEGATFIVELPITWEAKHD